MISTEFQWKFHNVLLVTMNRCVEHAEAFSRLSSSTVTGTSFCFTQHEKETLIVEGKGKKRRDWTVGIIRCLNCNQPAMFSNRFAWHLRKTTILKTLNISPWQDGWNDSPHVNMNFSSLIIELTLFFGQSSPSFCWRLPAYEYLKVWKRTLRLSRLPRLSAILRTVSHSHWEAIEDVQQQISRS